MMYTLIPPAAAPNTFTVQGSKFYSQELKFPIFFTLQRTEDLWAPFKHFHYSGWGPTHVLPAYDAGNLWDYFHWLNNLGTLEWRCRNMEIGIYKVSSLVITY